MGTIALEKIVNPVGKGTCITAFSESTYLCGCVRTGCLNKEPNILLSPPESSGLYPKCSQVVWDWSPLHSTLTPVHSSPLQSTPLHYSNITYRSTPFFELSLKMSCITSTKVLHQMFNVRTKVIECVRLSEPNLVWLSEPNLVRLSEPNVV